MVWENRAAGAGMTTGDTIRLKLRWETVKYGFGIPIHDLVYFLPDFWFWQNLWFTLGICQSLGGWLARSDSFQINPVSQARSYRSRPAWSHTYKHKLTHRHAVYLANQKLETWIISAAGLSATIVACWNLSPSTIQRSNIIILNELLCSSSLYWVLGTSMKNMQKWQLQKSNVTSQLLLFSSLIWLY